MNQATTPQQAVARSRGLLERVSDLEQRLADLETRAFGRLDSHSDRIDLIDQHIDGPAASQTMPRNA